jgi:aminotransferase
MNPNMLTSKQLYPSRTDQYKVCNRCVMDTSDPEILFNEIGVCNHCLEFDRVTSKNWFPNEVGQSRLNAMIQKIKFAGEGQQYDCILGLSGGVDSSYLAIKAYEWGLRPLVVHVDAGWNSEIAVANIEKIIKHCGFDLYTQVMDWAEMRDLHLSYLRAAVANQDVPQDHAFFSNLYRFATQNKIRYVLNGGNIATESIFPKAWHGSAMDAINLRAIHKKYGSLKLRNYKPISFFDYYIKYPFIERMSVVRPLDCFPYDKSKAISELEFTVGWCSYGRKHGESLFTKFFQNYYLPNKFGYDKRLPHFSSLIVSEQMTREEALAKLEEPLYSADELALDLPFFCKKLGISRGEFDELMEADTHHYTDFPNWDSRYRLLKKGQLLAEKITGKRQGLYS